MNVRTFEDLRTPVTGPRHGNPVMDESRPPLTGDSLQGVRRSGASSSTRGTMCVREGLAAPARFHATLLVESDAGRDEDDPRRPWFPDFEEVE